MVWPFSPSLARRRDKAAARASGALADFYAVPAPSEETPASELNLLSVDFETTGLDASCDQILSIGYVPVDGDAITLAGAVHRVLAARVEVGQSAVFHGITDDQLASGMPVEEAVAETLGALAGRVLLAHFAKIETEFLSLLCERLYGAPLVVPVVDTLVLHDRLVNRGFDDESLAGQLRLWNARTRYGLPVYKAHNALTDAVATAELYLAHVAEFSAEKVQTLKTLRSR